MKFKLSPVKNYVFMFLISVAFLYMIHLNTGKVISYLNTKMPPAFQILFLVLFLVLFCVVSAIIASYSKTREVGFSGQYTKKQSKYWQPLIIKLSFMGLISFLFLMVQIFVFSLLLYFAYKYLFWFFGDYLSGNIIVLHRGGAALVLAPFLIVLVLLVYFSIRILEKIGILNKNESKPK